MRRRIKVVDADLVQDEEYEKPTLFTLGRDVGGGVGGILFGGASAVLREAAGVSGLMPMNSTKNVGQWQCPMTKARRRVRRR